MKSSFLAHTKKQECILYKSTYNQNKKEKPVPKAAVTGDTLKARDNRLQPMKQGIPGIVQHLVSKQTCWGETCIDHYDG